MKTEETTIEFNIGNKTIIKLKKNGEIYVKGKLIENDIEVVNGMREIINRNKIYQINKALEIEDKLSQKQNDIDELVDELEKIKKYGVSDLELEILIQKHTK